MCCNAGAAMLEILSRISCSEQKLTLKASANAFVLLWTGTKRLEMQLELWRSRELGSTT